MLLKLLREYGWPVLSGLLAAVIILLAFPQILHRGLNGDSEVSTHNLSPANDDSWTGVISYAEAVERAAPSVVNIYTTTRQTVPRHPLLDDPFFRQFFNNSNLPQQQRMQSSLGSGVIISKEGYILTNNHVVKGADQILVLLYDGREAQAEVIGSDNETDLAVLKIALTQLTPINVGNPSNARVGDVVLAIGNPFGYGQSVSQGIISATGRNGLGLSSIENFLQTDAAINPGNSGGALIDAYGNLLGINSAILERSSNSVGVGFAIPADAALHVLEDLIQYGKVIRGWLGIEARIINRNVALELKLDPPVGMLVTNIAEDGPADKAGLQLGDILVRVNGRLVSASNQTTSQIASLRPGSEVSLEIWRNGEILNLQAVTGSRSSG